ncbi:hypothetical protein KO561_07375 [Radiobacillus kanasensis]|uniref:CBO0543 family protein n=1 Tax=Radiobacillus kanasensis TaxID=2844358 RepID=UPI001E4AE77A|nr:CBO0543 family protein [Radiobacillus kanasensis]UFU00747.1 hypothetical protein KO561_07375 [Radiobacillus kanasensis]
MSEAQKEMLHQLDNRQESLTKGYMEYWKEFSSFNTWQFWVILAMLVIPLIVLFFKMDRERAFLLGFFGFNVHIWFTYIDMFGAKLNYWSYPYQVMPLLSVNFGLDVSLIPVVFMFLYQWIIQHKKNFYVYFLGLCVFLSFVFKPILVALDLFQLNKGANYFTLFIGYVVIMLLSKWITNIFFYFKRDDSLEKL